MITNKRSHHVHFVVDIRQSVRQNAVLIHGRVMTFLFDHESNKAVPLRRRGRNRNLCGHGAASMAHWTCSRSLQRGQHPAIVSLCVTMIMMSQYDVRVTYSVAQGDVLCCEHGSLHAGRTHLHIQWVSVLNNAHSSFPTLLMVVASVVSGQPVCITSKIDAGVRGQMAMYKPDPSTT